MIPLINKDTDDKPQASKQSDSENVERKFIRFRPIADWLNAHYQFIYNEITQSLEISFSGSEFRPFRDKDLDNLVFRLESVGMTYPREKLMSLIRSDYVSVEINPIKDYFTNLSAVPGNEFYFHVCNSIKIKKLNAGIKGKTEFDIFFQLFRRWLMSCYHCALGRGGNQVCLVLVGAQGIYKSTWLDKLAPPELATYAVRTKIDFNTGNKEVYDLLAENFLVNIDDQLVGLHRKDAEVIKTFISQQSTKTRKAYAVNSVQRKRLANFVASVNEASFLTDTENRRYLCFEVDRCNPLELTPEVITGLWSNVKYWVENEQEQTYFNAEESELQRLLNEQFVALTPEREWLEYFFRPISVQEANESDYLLQSQIVDFLAGKVKTRISGRVLSMELERLGFIKKAKRDRDKVTRYWLVRKIRDRVEEIQPSNSEIPFS